MVAVRANIVKNGLHMAQVKGWSSILLLDTVRLDDHLKGSNGCEPVVRDKLGEMEEQGLAPEADAVGRVQDINAFSICMPARQQESHDANIVLFQNLPFALANLQLLHAPIGPWTEPSISHRWQPWPIPDADGASPLPRSLLVHDVHMEDTSTKGHGNNYTPDFVGQLKEEAFRCTK